MADDPDFLESYELELCFACGADPRRGLDPETNLCPDCTELFEGSEP